MNIYVLSMWGDDYHSILGVYNQLVDVVTRRKEEEEANEDWGGFTIQIWKLNGPNIGYVSRDDVEVFDNG